MELKILSKEAIPRALQRVERYRLLNEPREAESICLDVLRADPQNQEALAMLILALTDQFGHGFGVTMEHARKVLPQLTDEYERAYYAGVITERWGKAQIRNNVPNHVVEDWLRQAMQWFENAEKISPPDNDDALIRWNTCARIIERGRSDHPHSTTPPPVHYHSGLDDDVPLL
jgi:hypothetical protein